MLQNLLLSLALGLLLTVVVFGCAAVGATLYSLVLHFLGSSATEDTLARFSCGLFFSLWFILAWFAYKEG